MIEVFIMTSVRTSNPTLHNMSEVLQIIITDESYFFTMYSFFSRRAAIKTLHRFELHII
jgi:hypothetical protein